MSTRSQSPGVSYGPVEPEFKDRLDAEFETDDDEFWACHETAPTCTSCCNQESAACM